MGGICVRKKISPSNHPKPESYTPFEMEGKQYFIPTGLSSEYSLETIKKLGAGAFGSVFEIKRKSDNQPFAIKRLAFKDADGFSNIAKEINILYRLIPYGNIVKFIENYNALKEKSIYIVMEKADLTLDEMIKANATGFPSDLFHQLLIDMIYGLSYAYKEAVAHSDIKPANILVFKNQKREDLTNLHKSQEFSELIFKLTDFGGGTMKINDNHTKLRDGMGYTISYASPELLLSQKEENVFINFEKSDVYALGMTMLLCCGCDHKFLNHINKILITEKHDAEIEDVLLKLDNKYQDKIDLLRGMLKYDLYKRYDFKTLQEKMQIVLPPFETALQKRKKKQLSGNEDNLPPDEIASISNFDFSESFKKIECLSERFVALDKIANPIIKQFRTPLPNFKLFLEKTKVLLKNNKDFFTLKYELTGEIYRGILSEGFRTGIGIQRSADNVVYCGNFKRDFISDEGLMVCKDGNVFYGLWRNGMIESGYLFRNNDEIYLGDFMSDLPEGWGLELKKDGSCKYGIFEKGTTKEGDCKIEQIIYDDEINRQAVLFNNANIMNNQLLKFSEKETYDSPNGALLFKKKKKKIL